jgi:hypothetical protein
VAILVHKRLHMQARVFNKQLQATQGHVLSLRLDPRPVPAGVLARPKWLQRALVVTAVYVPPLQHGTEAAWGAHDKRQAILDAVHDIHVAIQRLWQSDDVLPITLAHLNAPDNACVVPLVGRRSLTAEAAQDVVTRFMASRGRRGRRMPRKLVDRTGHLAGSRVHAHGGRRRHGGRGWRGSPSTADVHDAPQLRNVRFGCAMWLRRSPSADVAW